MGRLPNESPLYNIVRNLNSTQEPIAIHTANKLVQSADEDNALLFEPQVIPPLVHMLSRDCDDCKIVAAKAIHVIAHTRIRAQTVVYAGAIEPLVTMLQSNTPSCRKIATLAIKRITSFEGFEHHIADEGCIHPLVQMLDVKDTEQCGIIITLFGDLATSNGLEKRILMDAQTLDTLCQCVCGYSNNLDLAYKSAGTLWNLSTPNELKPFIAQPNVLASLVKMLGIEYIDSCDVDNVLGLLGNLTVVSKLRQPVADAGVIDALVTLIRALVPTQLPDNLPEHRVCLVRHACSLLQNLSLHEDIHPSIVQSGALSLMVKLLDFEYPELPLKAAKVIFNVSTGEGMEKCICEEDAIMPLLALLRDGCDKSKDMAAGTLWNISSCEYGRQAISSIDMIFPQLIRHLENDAEQIGKSCLRTLNNIQNCMLAPHIQLKQGSILMLHSISSTASDSYWNSYWFTTIRLQREDLEDAMEMLSTLVRADDSNACTVAASILMNCDGGGDIDPHTLTEPYIRTELQPLLVRALCTDKFCAHLRQTVRMQNARAMYYVFKCASIPAHTPTVAEMSLDELVEERNTIGRELQAGHITFPEFQRRMRDVEHARNQVLLAHPRDTTPSVQAQKLAESFRSFRTSSGPTDLTVIVEGVRFPVHKLLLCHASTYFCAMFTNHMKEQHASVVETQLCSAHIFSVVHHFIYTGTVHGEITSDNACAVLQAATAFQIKELKVTMQYYLSQQLDCHNALNMWALAKDMQLSILERLSMKWILVHLVEIVTVQEHASIRPQLNTDGDEVVQQFDSTYAEAVVQAWFTYLSQSQT